MPFRLLPRYTRRRSHWNYSQLLFFLTMFFFKLYYYFLFKHCFVLISTIVCNQSLSVVVCAYLGRVRPWQLCQKWDTPHESDHIWRTITCKWGLSVGIFEIVLCGTKLHYLVLIIVLFFTGLEEPWQKYGKCVWLQPGQDRLREKRAAEKVRTVYLFIYWSPLAVIAQSMCIC